MNKLLTLIPCTTAWSENEMLLSIDNQQVMIHKPNTFFYNLVRIGDAIGFKDKSRVRIIYGVWSRFVVKKLVSVHK